jgi:EAL domain-containing protein (putative c-di-GMP-specific phosphodiesterase class I)
MLEACRTDIIDIINRNSLTVFFQPVVSVVKKTIIGFEALSRGMAAGKGGMIPPSELFRTAAEMGVSTELDRQCRRNAIGAFREIFRCFPEMLLFLNVDATAIENNMGSRHLLKTVESFEIPPRNIVIEINEAKVGDLNCLKSFINHYRPHGFLMALDDVGAGFSNLDRLTCTQPDIIKIDRSLVSGIDRNYSMQEVFKSLSGLSGKIGALTIAEGVETESEAMVLLELGADMLQGFFYGRPEPRTVEHIAEYRDRLFKSAGKYRDYMTSKLFEEKFEYMSYSQITDDFIGELSKVPGCQAECRLSELICLYSSIECIYVLDASGGQISGTVCRPDMKFRKTAFFQPALPGDDHSLKKYYYSLINYGLERYITDSYISLATGNLCRTISAVYTDCEGVRFILCIDISIN